jgi:hypothetical protein
MSTVVTPYMSTESRIASACTRIEDLGAPPIVLVLAAIVSVQIGAAFARTLFSEAGPVGVVMLRLVFGGAALGLWWRPRIRGRSRRDLILIGAFGATLACMNLSFYGAIDRIPLGIAVTLEFVGPLLVAIIGSRRPLDLAWVGLAAAESVFWRAEGLVRSILWASCWRLSPAVSGVCTSCSAPARVVSIPARADSRSPRRSPPCS